MTTKYNSNFGETMPFSDTTVRLSLASTTSQSYTVPGSPEMKYKASFKYTENSNIFIGKNTTVTSPTSGTQESTQTIEFKPDERYVSGGDVLSFLTPDTGGAYVGVALWWLTA
jgi:hypothetical protein